MEGPRRTIRLLDCFVVVALVVVGFALFWRGYIRTHPTPGWIWDLYDWKVWPLSRWR